MTGARPRGPARLVNPYTFLSAGASGRQGLRRSNPSAELPNKAAVSAERNRGAVSSVRLGTDPGNIVPCRRRRTYFPQFRVQENRVRFIPSREGYEQLGYLVAETMATMAIRDALEAGKSDIPLNRLQARVEKAFQLGALPEVWKLCWALVRKRGLRSLSRTMWSVAFQPGGPASTHP